MSRLLGRISRLEQRYGDCSTCRKRSALIELSTPEGQRPAGNDHDRSPCRDCGQPRELITLVFSFDPSALSDDKSKGSSPGSLQWEREQQTRRAADGSDA